MMHYPWRARFCPAIHTERRTVVGASIVGLLLLSFTLHAHAQPPATPARPLPAEISQRSFRMSEPNLDIELVIDEPRVVNPIAITWDADSYLYVLEIVGYASDQPTGRIKRLVDIDNDWNYDQGSFFARDLPWPRAMLPWRDGLLVYAGGDILYLRDTNEDGEADQRRVVLTGLGDPDGQPLPTGGLVRGLDNWIYAVANRPSARVSRPSAPADKVTEIPGFAFRFQPDTDRCEPVTGIASIGLVFDDWGHRFASLSDALPINLVALNQHDQSRMGSDLHATIDSLPASDDARLFPIAPPSRRWNSARGEFLRATPSLEVFRGNRLTPRCQGGLFICQPEGNLLHSRTLRAVGAGVVSERSDPGQEFLASNDPCFRPVQSATGPDGRMYVVDFYRPTLERSATLTSRSARNVDFNLGDDQGRLWRIVARKRLGAFRPDAPSTEPLPPRARLNFVDNAGLVHLLQHANGWWRDTAQRLLIERDAKDVEADLRAMLEQPGNVRARLHALWTLDGLGLLTDASLVAALNEFHPFFTANVVQVAAPRIAKSPELRAAMLARTRDRSPTVRFQVALAAAELSGTEAEDAVVQLAQGQLDDPLLRAAILMNTADRPWAYLQRITADDPGWFTFPLMPRLQLLHQLAYQVAARNDDADTNALLLWLGGTPQEVSVTHLALLDGVQQGLASVNRSLADLLASPPAELRPGLDAIMPVVQYGQGVAADATLDATSRAYGIAVLPLAGRAANAELMLRVLDASPSEPLAVAAVRNLIQAPATTYVEPTLAVWPKLGAVARAELVASLLASPDKIRYLVAALEKGTVPVSELDGAARFALARLPQSDLRSRAEAAVAKLPSSNDKQTPASFASSDGADSAAGAQLFVKQCQNCHQLMQFGVAIGPPLDVASKLSSANLREAILRPYRQVAPRFDVYLGVTSSNEVLLGRLRAATPTRVTLGRTDELLRTIPRDNITALESTSASFMPDHWPPTLTPADIASLVEFLRQPRRNFLQAAEIQNTNPVSLLFDGKPIPEEQPPMPEEPEPAPPEEAPKPEKPKRVPRTP